MSWRSLATVAGANAFSVAGLRERALFFPFFANGNRLFGQGFDVLRRSGRSRSSKTCNFALAQRRLRQRQPLFEHKLQQGLCLGSARRVGSPSRSARNSPSDRRSGRVSCPGQGRTDPGFKPRAAADHLPELDGRLDRLGEDEVDDFRHVDAGVEHVDRDRDGQVVVRAVALEVVDQLLGARVVVVDDLAEVTAILRIHLVEELREQDRRAGGCGRR